MRKLPTWRFEDGYTWDGDHTVVVTPGPAGLATSAGWRHWRRRSDSSVDLLVYQLLGAAIVWSFFPHLLAELMLGGMALYGAAAAAEAMQGRTRRAPLYELTWDEDALVVAGEHHYDREELQAIVWEPVEFYGYWTRRPVALGGQVYALLRDGRRVPAGSGTDLPRLRALAERLSAELRVQMVEKLAHPLVRSPDALDRPVTGALAARPRQWRRLPSYSHWKLKRTVWQTELSIGDGRWSRTALAEVLDHYGTWLLTVAVLDLVRLPVLLWGTLLGLRPDYSFGADAWELLLHGLAVLPVVYGLYHDHRARRLLIERGQLHYEVDGRTVASLPVAAIEQVRHETFPRPAVRIVSDGRDILIDNLPAPIDYEALADQLPHLLPAPPESAEA